MKKNKVGLHPYYSSMPVIYFLVFLHPLYLVQLFEINQMLLSIFRALTVVVVAIGLLGVCLYGLHAWQAYQSGQIKPVTWYLLPLNIVNSIIIVKFLIGVVLIS